MSGSGNGTDFGHIVAMLGDVLDGQREIRGVLNDHTRVLNDHTRILTDHTRVLNEHTLKLARQLLAQNRLLGLVHPVQLEETLRRVHADADKR